jgi:hypothetical protein
MTELAHGGPDIDPAIKSSHEEPLPSEQTGVAEVVKAISVALDRLHSPEEHENQSAPWGSSAKDDDGWD